MHIFQIFSMTPKGKSNFLSQIAPESEGERRVVIEMLKLPGF